MALKRKASLSVVSAPNATATTLGDVTSIEEPPKYLNSRTRKRLRDNRPNDEAIYRAS